ncbi:MAG: hypothetical protein DMG05_21870 [Acidobacteria bacterium]|nr:MAG: hypothetical protein DMG05_21870 [Acidobacteriota bacterium]
MDRYQAKTDEALRFILQDDHMGPAQAATVVAYFGSRINYCRSLIRKISVPSWRQKSCAEQFRHSSPRLRNQRRASKRSIEFTTSLSATQYFEKLFLPEKTVASPTMVEGIRLIGITAKCLVEIRDRLPILTFQLETQTFVEWIRVPR